ncbi:protein kinase domain-containing protein [Actinomadura rubrisoli]|uniref:FHA domain-containing protein n=1 Tax=Actinomadura rubrisoli TaxID=2530368 RepID=A0A4R5C381_9ACTN|nr:protein kinase [Actinomadura rubrisoli]TDD93019.1 FHA domain-containing protein [Actinomadura rubrisoli]
MTGSTAPEPPTVTLTLVKGRLDRTEFVFDERTTCVLGRADDCAPRLPDDEHHRTVSRHHCLIDVNPPDVRVRDFGSLNGTYVNGSKIGQREKHLTAEEGAARSYPEHDLADGDEIRLGETVFRVDVRLPTGAGTRVMARCAKCGREVGDEIGARSGEYVCADCRQDPAAVARLLVDLARSERRDLAPIAGYAVLRELGRGGMGAVYLARHEDTGAEVALKVMLPKVAANAVSRARFLREAELTRALRHPNIAALYDAGSANGVFYFTTEYCAGGSLDRLLADRGGRLPAAEAVRLAVQVLDGLEHAHGEGVVHRDLSPSNILLRDAGDGSPVAKIADFGLAKAFDQAGLSGLTRTGATAGKPGYMPRQQVVNFRNVAPAVDVWALAACLYHVLTGEVPRRFRRGKDPWQTILQEKPTPIRQRDPDIPRALAAVIDQGLQERPSIGFQHAADLRRALLAATT